MQAQSDSRIQITARRLSYRADMKAPEELHMLKEYVRHRLRLAVDEGDRGTRARISEETGLSASKITQTYGDEPLGDDALTALLDHFHLSIERGLTEARAWWPTQAKTPLADSENLRDAIRAEERRMGSKVSSRARGYLQSELRDGGDLPVEEWIHAIRVSVRKDAAGTLPKTAEDNRSIDSASTRRGRRGVPKKKD